MEIRVANKNDGKDILKIYKPYIEKTNITFEYAVPSVEEMEQRIEKTLERYPYLVGEVDGHIAGYAYASLYRSRQAYNWDCELSIYVDENYHGSGIATLLYNNLLEILKLMNIQNVYACITYPNEKSERFHHRLGFEKIGVFKKCGYKFKQWHDVVWMDKQIGNYDDVKDIILFSDLTLEQINHCLKNTMFK